MASGKTHARIAGITTVSVCAAAPALVMFGQTTPDIAAGLAIGAACGYFVTPDIDIPHRTHEEWRMIRRLPVLGRLWAAYWAAYGQLFTHRGISHAPFIGTLTRVVYGFWWVVFVPWAQLLPFQYAAWSAFMAWSAQDMLHLAADGFKFQWRI